MCGFAGILHRNGQPVESGDLALMLRRLHHRGPDELCAVRPEEHVGLAHARLKVLDLSARARQPMTNEDQTVWLVYNGEIYNFASLRQERQELGYSFRSHSDTEVILRAYEAWGEEAIPRLDGMFALALWDNRQQQLLLARDRAGKKPLFYYAGQGCIAFASEIKGLLPHSHVPREVNEGVLPFLLSFGYPPQGETCYRDIHQIPPATFLLFSAEKSTSIRRTYWHLDFSAADQPPSEAEATNRIRTLLTEAVHRRMVADVPLGVFLSGGIDSTLVAGLMSRLHSQPIRTFSIGFEGDARFDETGYARLASERFGTRHTVFTVTPQSFDLLERLVWHHDQPFGDSSAIPTYLISQLSRPQVTVALAGDGGDEAFAGYLRFQACRWAESIPRPLLRTAALLTGWMPAGLERSGVGRVHRFLRAASLDLPERYWRWISYFPAKGLLRQIDPSLDQWWNRSRGWSPLSRLLHLNFQEYLPNDLLVKMDRTSMAHGLEVRSPFLDTALLEYVARLPDSLKLRGRQSKVILKKAFSDLLPSEIRNRPKMGFGIPLATWLRGGWRPALEEHLLPKEARIHRYLDRAAVEQIVESHLSGREDAGHRLWLLLTLETWLRQMASPRDFSRRAEIRWLDVSKEGASHA